VKAPIAVEGHGTSLTLNGLIEDILILGPPFFRAKHGRGVRNTTDGRTGRKRSRYLIVPMQLIPNNYPEGILTSKADTYS
jgi:hypothetical protein